MKSVAKWTIGLFSALIVAVPLSFGILIWTDFHKTSLTRQREAADVIAQFHQRFNAREFNKICDDAVACRGSANLRNAWQALLEDVRDRAGSFSSVSQSDIKVYIEPPSVQANLVSVFEKTELREVFVMKDYDGPLRIVTYQTVSKESADASQ